MSLPSLQLGDKTAKYAIIQGGMGVGISLHNLAAAVANEGGIGVIAAAMIGMREPDVAQNPLEANLRAIRKEIAKAKELSIGSNGLLGMNIMVALTNFAEMVKTAVSEKIDVIFSGAGMPLELPKYLFEACEERKETFNTKLVPIVSSARAASLLCRKWLSKFDYLPDAFVVEGPKAGGHLGFKLEELDSKDHELEELVPQVVEAVKAFEDKKGCAIPVIAAGGIYTGADIKKFLDLGASGVQMGTRFVATHECDADIRFKEAFINAKAEDLTIIKSPVGMPGRAIRNSFIEAVEKGQVKFKCIFQCVTTCDPKNSPYCIASALLNAMKGNLDKGFAFSGVNAYRVDTLLSVKELIASLQAEYDAAVKA
ncbi:NAD(P)H-dependent flavin oxidoreductase [Desulfovibrio litoralis]|uniref:NAD(P)H-dependent flavin oxidoreductase YrpB, nitropropane dioxygenase family n=1 Tax=Desulfovibrio litoralis DSM 11393 TaxID=1121455 RepID=A0A1M7SLD5_9BACT|nr:nitronate monooxygenase [Desulfovibrio litoralis]SHN59264.1 NAD(P)H-dependent flavin oxidoreductase YrpB, nitropropane dioxygenase family [Desulfovibrio litoralis DSM 11393]